MGLGGINIWSLVLILAIVIVLFGTKRLRSIGSDLGDAIKGFRKAVSEDDKPKQEEEETPPAALEKSSAAKADASKANADAKSENK